MQTYLNLLKHIVNHGSVQRNRTGIDTIRIPTAMMSFDMADGYPLVTTRKMFTKGILGELIGFIRGYDNAADFRKLGCNLWNQNANENKQWLANPHRKGEDDLGRIYGVQWRNWQAPDGQVIDQLANAVNDVIHNPESRRIIVDAWNPADINKCALPPCHTRFRLMTDSNSNNLTLIWTQRSTFERLH